MPSPSAAPAPPPTAALPARQDGGAVGDGVQLDPLLPHFLNPLQQIEEVSLLRLAAPLAPDPPKLRFSLHPPLTAPSRDEQALTVADCANNRPPASVLVAQPPPIGAPLKDWSTRRILTFTHPHLYTSVEGRGAMNYAPHCTVARYLC